MAGELKRDPASKDDGSRRAGGTAPSAPARWFAALPGGASHAAPPASIARGAAALLAFALLLALAAASGVTLRALLPIALATFAFAVVSRVRRRRGAEAPPSRRGLSLDDAGLSFVSAGGTSERVLRFGTLFGVTLVTTRARDRLVAAVTSSSGIFYVGADIDDAARRELAPLLGRASALATDDAGLDAVGPDGEALDLSPPELSQLVGELSARDGACLDRVVLSDARGAPFSVDTQELRVSGATFELAAPLEWRAFVFQERFGQAVAVYQATWVKQGLAEVVIVSLLPSLSPVKEGGTTGIPEIDRATVRDLRLMQAIPDEPPPPERRIAIDRLFMLPVRVALDRAPRASQHPSHARA